MSLKIRFEDWWSALLSHAEEYEITLTESDRTALLPLYERDLSAEDALLNWLTTTGR